MWRVIVAGAYFLSGLTGLGFVVASMSPERRIQFIGAFGLFLFCITAFCAIISLANRDR